MAAMTPLGIKCPVCEQTINVPVTATIRDGEFAHLGMAVLDLEPDTTDLWAHMWTHDPTPGD